MKGKGGTIMNNKVKVVAIVAAGVIAGTAIAVKVVKNIKARKQEKESK
jgi:hypothetical protein